MTQGRNQCQYGTASGDDQAKGQTRRRNQRNRSRNRRGKGQRRSSGSRREAQPVEQQDVLYAIIADMQRLENRKLAIDGLSTAGDQVSTMDEVNGEERVRTMLSTLDSLRMAEGQVDEDQMNKDLRCQNNGKSHLEVATGHSRKSSTHSSKCPAWISRRHFQSPTSYRSR